MTDLGPATQNDVIVNPATGELIDLRNATVAALKAALLDTEKALGDLYPTRRAILERLGEEPYKVPKPIARTDTQQKLSRCPRCSAVLRSEGEGPKAEDAFHATTVSTSAGADGESSRETSPSPSEVPARAVMHATYGGSGKDCPFCGAWVGSGVAHFCQERTA